MVVPGVNVNGDPATYLKGWIVITLSSKKKGKCLKSKKSEYLYL